MTALSRRYYGIGLSNAKIWLMTSIVDFLLSVNVRF